MAFIKKGGGGDHKILCNFQDVCGWCYKKGDFSDTLDLHRSKKKKLFIISYFSTFFFTFSC